MAKAMTRSGRTVEGRMRGARRRTTRAMTRPGAGLTIAALLAAALFALAFVVSPRACEGGLEVYAVAGAVAIVAWLALPFAARLGRTLVVRGALAFGFAVAGAGVWIGGLAAADVRIFCRLF